MSEVEALKIWLELSLSDANVRILSRDSQQPIISKLPVGAGFLNTSDVATRVTHTVEVSDVIWPFDIELYVDLGKYTHGL